MIKRVIVTWCLLHILNAEDFHDEDQATSKVFQRTPNLEPREKSRLVPLGKQAEKQCLTGYMTDVQTWVDQYGNLNPSIDFQLIIDVSSRQDPVLNLQQQIEASRVSKTAAIKYLSMSSCRLRRVPTVFNLADRQGRTLYSTIEYLTLYGNEFAAVSDAGVEFDEFMNATRALEFSDVTVRWPGPTTWAAGLSQVTFKNLKELDLRKCNIQTLTDNLFKNMPLLEALYLGENQITFIAANAFTGLESLVHLDLSRNVIEKKDTGMVFEHRNVFNRLEHLRSLDLSFTTITLRHLNLFRDLHNLKRLSICYAGIHVLPRAFFNKTSLRFLDISGNNGILSGIKPFEGIEDKLEILYAKEVGLKTFNVFHKLEKLEVLNVESNEVSGISSAITKSLNNLQVLNLNRNRITLWFEMLFSYMKPLKLLSLKDNNINAISPEMIVDIQNISYVGLSGNVIVCNCNARELFEVAYQNENKTSKSILQSRNIQDKSFSSHRGFDDFNKLIESRNSLTRSCDVKYCQSSENIDAEGNFLFFDYKENSYECLDFDKSKPIPFSQVKTCSQTERGTDYVNVITENRRKLLALIAIPATIFPILIFLYVFRRNLKYFCITIRNSATLSLINKNKGVDDGTIYHYDVFVSYCHDDRNWVLDELLPNVEKGCNINVCLHERDFQVGLSILENIVSCMDRSRSIMLIISKQFLMSQWCQFEMHLAQHRLLETRREDLILVLLEDIPRRLRPTTLHYLMLTKTYIVWPKKEGDHQAFWRRLSRSILARRQVSQDNVSLV